MENEIEDIHFSQEGCEVFFVNKPLSVNISDFAGFCYRENLIPNVRDPYDTDIHLMYFTDFCAREDLSFKAMERYLLTQK